MADLFDPDILGMVRHNDHDSSIAAAHAALEDAEVKREKVLVYAKMVGSRAFIDDDLIDHYDAWDTPSSYRKRRSDLYEEGIILKTTERRPNRNRIRVVVWVHRDFASAYTVEPWSENEDTPKKLKAKLAERDARIAELEAENERLRAGRLL